jgi:hypothetical protein
MRYIPLLIALTGCATTSELNQVKSDLTQANKKLDASVYHLQVESCKTDTLICAINAAVNQSGEETCIKNYMSCLAVALDQYRAANGHEPPDLFEPKRAR